MAEVVKAVETSKVGVNTDSNSNLMAALAWLFCPLSSLIFILIDTYKKDKYIQFHAWQSLAFGAVNFVVWTFLGWTCILPLAALVVTIIGVVKAFQGEMWKAPLIGDWAEQQANKAEGSKTV
jgi:uncharacterized membrane protein